jgi:hypothetical protein
MDGVSADATILILCLLPVAQATAIPGIGEAALPVLKKAIVWTGTHEILPWPWVDRILIFFRLGAV